MLAPMPVHERRADRGARHARQIDRKLGLELRNLRRLAGLSQRSVAHELGVHHAVVSRIETGAATTATMEMYARLFAVVGGRLSVTVHPDGQPLRDAAHLRLIDRLCGLLPATIRVRREVPLGIPKDLRAWDVLLMLADDRAAVEAETMLDDLQALDRKIALKQQDSGMAVVILLIAGTDRNRRILRAHREALRDRFPLDTREALAHLRAGRLPPQGAIIVL